MVLGPPQNVKDISTRCFFLWVKADKITTFMCQISRNPGSLNLLEIPGPVKCFNGIALLITKSNNIRVINRVAKWYMKEETNENCALLGYDAACSRNSLPTFRHNLPVQSSGIKNTSWGKPGMSPSYKCKLSYHSNCGQYIWHPFT
jgi:hypothetical protein